ncbi:hypothetical protein QJQ45_015224 [Haematococcus lacustris]|nr:hypothetical protein QJQ45_015224 [Haematococcus lacustris]
MSAGRSILFELKSWAKYLLPSKYIAVYYGSPPSVVSRMLEIANCGPKDVVYDLGCGDGRVLIAAAQRGAQAEGWELDPELCAEAEATIARAGLQGQCRVVRGDAARADVGRATIITLYLSEHGNRSLLQQLRPRLQPGTRVVSNFFPVQGWEALLVRTCTADPATGPLHLYQVTAPWLQAS